KHAAADILSSIEAAVERKRRVRQVLLSDYRQRADVVHREAGHEPGTIGSHRQYGRLSGNRAAPEDNSGGDFVDEHVRRGPWIGESNDELAVRGTDQLAEKRRIRPD